MSKATDEAESESDELAVKLAAVSDLQFPGKRIQWNGFETHSFNFRNNAVRVIAPKLIEAEAPWTDGRRSNRSWNLTAELNNEASRAAGRGST